MYTIFKKKFYLLVNTGCRWGDSGQKIERLGEDQARSGKRQTSVRTGNQQRKTETEVH